MCISVKYFIDNTLIIELIKSNNYDVIDIKIKPKISELEYVVKELFNDLIKHSHDVSKEIIGLPTLPEDLLTPHKCHEYALDLNNHLT